MSWWCDQLAQILEKQHNRVSCSHHSIFFGYFNNTVCVWLISLSYEVILTLDIVQRWIWRSPESYKKVPVVFTRFWGDLIFFGGANCCGQQSIKGKEWRFTTNEGDCKNITEPYLGGGDHVKFIVTQPKSIILSEFSPLALETFTSRRKKISLCYEV